MLWFQHCFHACAGLLAMGRLLLSDSTFWTHYADQEAQLHCIVCNLDAIDGWLQLRYSAILATISFCIMLTS